MSAGLAPLGVEPWAWTTATEALRRHQQHYGDQAAVTVEHLVEWGAPRAAAVIVLAVLADTGVLHLVGGGLAARPDLPSLSTPGYVWEWWHTPSGGRVEIVAERPRPRTSRHRGSVGVIWQCTVCQIAAGERVRLAVTRARAVGHLHLHLRDVDVPSHPEVLEELAVGFGGVPPLPPGWVAASAEDEPGSLASKAEVPQVTGPTAALDRWPT